jgi:hypothetical protein
LLNESFRGRDVNDAYWGFTFLSSPASQPL